MMTPDVTNISHIFEGAIPVYTGESPKVTQKSERGISASGDVTRHGFRLCHRGSNILVTRP